MSGPRRGGLGRGLGALIAPAAPRAAQIAPDIDLTHPASPAAERDGRAGAGGGPAEHDHEQGSTPTLMGGTAVHGTAVPTPEVDGPASAGQRVGELRMVPLAAVVPNPRQPRTVFDDDALSELAASIREVGLLQPVIVRPTTGPHGPAYELVMGERRWRACGVAGLEEIPAVVRTTPDDDLLRDALLENLHRAQLNALEEAAAYQQLLSDFGCTHDELAERLGRSRSHISNTIRLLGLSPAVQRRVAAGVLSAGHARALLGLGNPDRQGVVAARIVAEGLSVRVVEEIVALERDASPPAPGRAPRAPRAEPPELQEVAERLADRLETRVTVAMGRSRGQITVEFASVVDLDRITTAILSAGGPEAPVPDSDVFAR